MNRVKECLLLLLLSMLICGCGNGMTTVSEKTEDTANTENMVSSESSEPVISIETEVLEEPTPVFLDVTGMTLKERFLVPDGYKRTDSEKGSFSAFLRSYPLKEDGVSVLLYNGEEKANQSAHAAVFKLPLENADLQQCADSIMRMYAEYYWHSGQYDKIKFHFTNGFLCEYEKWMEGYRVVVSGNDVSWQKEANYDASYDTFIKYMRVVFNYAGTLSMDTYESESIPLSELKAGDVILKGGSPGHVIMVVDVCANDEGKKAFLFAQGYMPAQEFHVINNPLHNYDPWYYEEEMTFPLSTAEYTFGEEKMLKRLLY